MTPGVGEDAQDVINRQIADDYDIFIGIMWARFGSPTKRADSGTQEEFERALQRFQDIPDSLEILLYFKDTPIPPSQLDPEQLSKVKLYQKNLSDSGILYSTFSTIDEFTTNTRMHMSRAVQRWVDRIKNGYTVTKTNEPIKNDESSEIDAYDESDDEGLIDLVERANDSILRTVDVLTRMTITTENLGQKMKDRTLEIDQVKKSSRGSNLKLAKRISNNAAIDLEEFVKRMNVDIPAFSDSIADAMDAFGKAATISAEINPNQKEDLVHALNQVISYRGSMKQTSDQIKGFREIISRLPKMTKEFNKARRHAVTVLDDLISRIEIGERQCSEVEKVLTDLLQ